EAAFLGNIGQLADAADAAGVVIALEIHGDIMASSDVTLPLLEKIGRDSVKVNYDTANVEFYSGDLATDDLPKITKELAHVHLKDTTGGKGNWNFPAVGDGTVDFERVLSILRDASPEDHGDHGPLWTDVYIPVEIAKRAAAQLEALVGPPIPFGLAADHRGAHGLVQVRMDTFLDLVRDVCVSLAGVGFRRIVLLNGHYCNSHALAFASSGGHDELPEGTRIYPFPYWAGLKPEEAEQYLSGSVGIHANVGETSIVFAIDENLCDMERVRDFVPELPELRTSARAVIDPVFPATPGSFWSILEAGGGVWGKPSESTA